MNHTNRTFNWKNNNSRALQEARRHSGDTQKLFRTLSSRSFITLTILVGFLSLTSKSLKVPKRQEQAERMDTASPQTSSMLAQSKIYVSSLPLIHLQKLYHIQPPQHVKRLLKKMHKLVKRVDHPEAFKRHIEYDIVCHKSSGRLKHLAQLDEKPVEAQTTSLAESSEVVLSHAQLAQILDVDVKEGNVKEFADWLSQKSDL